MRIYRTQDGTEIKCPKCDYTFLITINKKLTKKDLKVCFYCPKCQKEEYVNLRNKK